MYNIASFHDTILICYGALKISEERSWIYHTTLVAGQIFLFADFVILLLSPSDR